MFYEETFYLKYLLMNQNTFLRNYIEINIMRIIIKFMIYMKSINLQSFLLHILNNSFLMNVRSWTAVHENIGFFHSFQQF